MKVLCKRKLFKPGDGIFKIDFKVGYFYSTTYELDDCYWVEMDNGFSQRFDKIGGGIYKYKLSDYFYTEQEIRKLKILKLNEMPSLFS